MASIFTKTKPAVGSDLPRILANDPEIMCMQEVLASLMKLEAIKGVRARERALQWAMNRLGEEDQQRMDTAREFGDG